MFKIQTSTKAVAVKWKQILRMKVKIILPICVII